MACKGTFSKAGMSKHVNSCPKRVSGQKTRSPTRTFHLRVAGRYNPAYWLHVEAAASSSLAELDEFLRSTWLECCGHLSAFTIGRWRYTDVPGYDEPGDDEKDLDIELGEVLAAGMTFLHEYDFGSTTTLVLKVISEWNEGAGGSGIQLLARNDPPVIPCDACGKPATKVCCECVDEETGWLCEACARKHDCDEDLLLPVVNSPRVGTCDYRG